MPAFYYVARLVAKLLFGLLVRKQVKGLENVPSKGPLILVSNHLHNADVPLLAISIQRGIVFMAKEELFHPWWGWAVKGFGALPVKRGMVERATLRRALQVLKDGKVLCIYPEGARSHTAQLQQARNGVALIAYESRSLLLPVGIFGTEKLHGAFWWLRRMRVIVNIGKPFSIPDIPGGLNKEVMTSLTDYIMGHIAELLPPDYRGAYGESSKSRINTAVFASMAQKEDSHES